MKRIAIKTAFPLFLAFVFGYVVAILAPFVIPEQPNPPDQKLQWGTFPVKAKTEWTDGREMRLLEPFVYVDPRQKAWIANADTIIDGASIPRAFWTIVGGPFEGNYRNASIVHDAACEQQTDSPRDVHRMFYEACRCGGVPESQAKVLYGAVYHFGPRWTPKGFHTPGTRTDPGLPTFSPDPSPEPSPTSLPQPEVLSEAVAKQFADMIEQGKLDLSQIESIDTSKLRTELSP